MKARLKIIAWLGLALLLALVGTSQAYGAINGGAINGAGDEPQTPEGGGGPGQIGDEFTYQGELRYNNQPVNDNCDFQFSLWDRSGTGAPPTGGIQFGSTHTATNVPVTDGRFTVVLNSANQFSGGFRGPARWLQISALCPGGAGTFTVLSPRQPIFAVPYAIGLVPGAYVFNTNAADSNPHGLWVDSTNGTAVVARTHSGTEFGVAGANYATDGTGVFGDSPYIGVRGNTSSYNGTIGVNGTASHSSCGILTNTCYGVLGTTTTGYGTAGMSISGVGIYGYSGGGNPVLRVESGSSGNLIEAWRGPNLVDREFYVSNNGEVYADGSFHSGGADVAEHIDSRQALQPGDVVEIDPNNPGLFRLSQGTFSTLVAGVVSTAPGVTINHDGDVPDDQRPQLALVGQVPVKVSAENGPIRPGDLLVTSSTPGYAMKAGPNPAVGTVIGKALAAWDTGTGVILMLVMLR